MSIRQLSFIVAAFCFCVFQQAVSGAEAKRTPTTVALTAAVPTGADAAERELATSLLALLEPEMSQDPRLSVVERRQIDLVLHELASSVDLSKSSEKKLRLGKLVNADLLLTTELLPPEKDSAVQNVLVRIVESLTGAIRGVVVTHVKAVSVDESAAHIAKYLSAIAARPRQAVVTVAVAPFCQQFPAWSTKMRTVGGRSGCGNDRL